MTLREALDRFLAEGYSARHSPKTLAHYDWTLTRFLAWLAPDGAPFAAGDLSAGVIRDYLAHLRDQELATATVNTAGRAIRALCYFALREGLISHNPFEGVRLAREDKRQPTVCSDDDLRRLFDACENARDRATLALFVDCGLRLGECAGLTWGDVDLRTGRVLVRLGKGRKDRVVFAGLRTRALLTELGPRGDHLGVLCQLQEPAVALSGEGVRQVILRLGRKAGVIVGPHRLRRTFATRMLAGGCDVYTLARLMGHGDITILRYYLAQLEDDLRRACERYGVLDRLLANGGTS